MLKTIQEYANEKGTSQQNVRNKKSLTIVNVPIFALYKGEYLSIGTKKFVDVENNCTENQQLIK